MNGSELIIMVRIIYILTCSDKLSLDDNQIILSLARFQMTSVAGFWANVFY